MTWAILILLLVMLYIVYECFPKNIKEGFMTGDDQSIINPRFLDQVSGDPGALTHPLDVIQRQDNQIRTLREHVKRLAELIDSGDADRYRDKFYSRKLSNKYYNVMPHLWSSNSGDSYLNLNDDDFSTKTLSTIKFLEQTRPSKYYGIEVHFPTELCDNFCETEDGNAKLNENIDIVRPLKPADYVQEKSK